MRRLSVGTSWYVSGVLVSRRGHGRDDVSMLV